MFSGATVLFPRLATDFFGPIGESSEEEDKGVVPRAFDTIWSSRIVKLKGIGKLNRTGVASFNLYKNWIFAIRVDSCKMARVDSS